MEFPRADPKSTVQYYTVLEEKKKADERAISLASLTSLFRSFASVGESGGQNPFYALQGEENNLADEGNLPVEGDGNPVTIFRAVDNDSVRRDKLYQPLNSTKKEFRVVQLCSGIPTEPIACNLVHESFLDQHAPSYQPLSYVVGNVDDTKNLLVNGVKFRVTSNLHSALVHLRGTQGECRIWIDQLCINQTDAEEKASQVLLMREIFSHGSRTFVWIPDTVPDKSASATALIRRVFNDFVAQYNVWFKTAHLIHASRPSAVQDVYTKVCRPYCDVMMDSGGRQTFLALQKLIHDPYWERCWIWQEICVSKESLILWGENSLRWEELAEAIRVLGYCGSFLEQWVWREKEVSLSERKDVEAIASSLRASWLLSVKEARTAWWPRTPHLRELLSLSRGLKSTDPRDRIYGILGLARERDRLVPNYKTSSMPAACIRATLKCIRTERSLDILCEANERDRHHEWNLPSWTPDFSVLPGRLHSLVPGMIQGHSFVPDVDATKGLKPDFSFPGSSARILRVKIVKFSDPLDEFSLGVVGSAEKPTEPQRDWLNILMAQTTFVPGVRHPVCTNERLYPESFFRTMSFGMDWAAIAARNPAAKQWLQELTQKDAHATEVDASLKEAMFSGNWRFFMGGACLPGMVPAATTAGDLLCFVPGARVPFVIRERKEEPDGGYTLIGGCYIHGYMHGKIVEDLQKGQVRLEEVDLY